MNNTAYTGTTESILAVMFPASGPQQQDAHVRYWRQRALDAATIKHYGSPDIGGWLDTHTIAGVIA